MLVEPEAPLVYKEWMIPPGTPVGMTLSHLHMDEMIFPEPSTFNPSRWTNAKALEVDLDKYFVPFSKGNRACLGVK